LTLQNAGRFLAGCLQRLASPILANPSLIIYMSMLVFVPFVGAMDEEGGEYVNTTVGEAVFAITGVAVAAAVANTRTTFNSGDDDEESKPPVDSDSDSPKPKRKKSDDDPESESDSGSDSSKPKTKKFTNDKEQEITRTRIDSTSAAVACKLFAHLLGSFVHKNESHAVISGLTKSATTKSSMAITLYGSILAARNSDFLPFMKRLEQRCREKYEEAHPDGPELNENVIFDLSKVLLFPKDMGQTKKHVDTENTRSMKSHRFIITLNPSEKGTTLDVETFDIPKCEDVFFVDNLGFLEIQHEHGRDRVGGDCGSLIFNIDNVLADVFISSLLEQITETASETDVPGTPQLFSDLGNKAVLNEVFKSDYLMKVSLIEKNAKNKAAANGKTAAVAEGEVEHEKELDEDGLSGDVAGGVDTQVALLQEAYSRFIDDIENVTESKYISGDKVNSLTNALMRKGSFFSTLFTEIRSIYEVEARELVKKFPKEKFENKKGFTRQDRHLYGVCRWIKGCIKGGEIRAALSELVKAARKGKPKGSTVVVEHEGKTYTIKCGWKTNREAGELGGKLCAALSTLVEAARKDAPEDSTVVVEHEGNYFAISSDWKTNREAGELGGKLGGKLRAALSELVEAARKGKPKGSTVVVEHDGKTYTIKSDWKTNREAGELGGKLCAALSTLVEAARKGKPKGSTVVVEHDGKTYTIKSDWKTLREAGELRAALLELVEAARKGKPKGSTVVVEHDGKTYTIKSDWNSSGLYMGLSVGNAVGKAKGKGTPPDQQKRNQRNYAMKCPCVGCEVVLSQMNKRNMYYHLYNLKSEDCLAHYKYLSTLSNKNLPKNMTEKWFSKVVDGREEKLTLEQWMVINKRKSQAKPKSQAKEV